MSLQINDNAPLFSAQTDSSGSFELSSVKGKWVVLYFYPKDNTSGCTQEACDFRDNMHRLSAMDAVIIGISPDSPKSHDSFKAKQKLNFILVSDEDKSICEKYFVWTEKTMYGKKYMGVLRSTFIIDPDGLIRYIYPKVSVGGHVENVMNTLKELQKSGK